MPQPATPIRQIIFASNRGGVGKSTSAIITYGAMKAAGRTPVLLEAERTTERVFGRLLTSMGIKVDEIIQVALPAASTYANDPGKANALFSGIYQVLVRKQDAIIDLGAGVALDFLAAAADAEHGDFVENEGANITLVACCTADDVASWDGAAQAVQAFRKVYPNGEFVVVINRCRGNGGGTAASEVFRKAGLTRVIEIPEQASSVMGELFGRTSIAPDRILELYDAPDLETRRLRRLELQKELGSASVAESNLQLKQFKLWYLSVREAFHTMLLGNIGEDPSAVGGGAKD